MKLTKRGKIWWIDYRANGKRHRQSTGTADKAVARAFMEQIDVARRMPSFEAAVAVLRQFYPEEAPQGMLPLSGIWETYTRLAAAVGKDKLSHDTLRGRRNHVERLIAWISKKRATIKFAEHVTGPIAAGFAEYLGQDLKLKTKTRRNIIGDLSTVWNTLEKASTGVRNPWLHLAPPDTDGRRGMAFERDQERAVLEAAKKVGKDWWPICAIMQGTGLRYGDVAMMEWSEIQGDVIRLKPNKTRRHGIAVAIPIVGAVREALDSLVRRGDFLFPLHAEYYQNKKSRSQKDAGLAFREVLDLAGITGEGYSIHSWRHTAATRLAEAGADIETRKRILGHTEDVTARRYDHDEHLDETRAALQHMLAS